MPDYRRVWSPGGTYFFTVVTHQRRPILIEAKARRLLQQAFLHARQNAGAFQIDALCLLPDHLHCIWTLPENDCDYATRWKIIKAYFSHSYRKQGGASGALSESKIKKGELGIWQRRYWEHLIHDREDLYRHVNYIHYNPVKHGLVQSAGEWPWSTFHRYVREGHYASDWGDKDFIPVEINSME